MDIPVTGDCSVLSDGRRTLLHEEFDAWQNRTKWVSLWNVTAISNCTLSASNSHDSFSRRAVYFSARPQNPTKTNRTAVLLESDIREFDISSYARVGIDVTLKVTEKGNGVDAFFGLITIDDIANYLQGGVNGSWPFCVFFNNGSITFRGNQIMSYDGDWIRTRIIFDFSRHLWNCNIPSWNVTEGEISDLSIDNVISLAIGFDGENQSVAFDDLELFYFLPEYEIAAPGQCAVQSGGTANFNVTVQTLEDLDSYFALSVSGLPLGWNHDFEPASIPRSLTSNLSILTSTETPAGAYPINVTALYRIDKTNENVTRSHTVLVVVTNPPALLWNQWWFWLTFIAFAIAISTSLLSIKAERDLQSAINKAKITMEEKGHLICKNPDCGFKEVPADSKYCPVCGKPINKK